MEQYLVIGRCGMDDIPMRLFDSHAAAEDYIKAATEVDVIEAAEGVMGVGVSHVIGLAILTFRGGIPGRVTHARELS